MILTCPACASRYEVDAASIPAHGRTVRCAGCSHSWRAEPPRGEAPPLELQSLPSELNEPDLAAPAAALPKKIRAENRARRQTRDAVAAGAVWGVLGALVLAVVGGAALFRVDVVRLWPRTAGAYAKVGLTVNPTGLAPEAIQAGPGLKNGHAAVLVSGLVRNVETRAHDPVPLRIALLDKAGKPLVGQVVRLADGALAPGQTRPFSAVFLDPPTDSANVQVAFALDLVDAARPGRPAEVQPPKLRGMAQPTLPPLPPPQPVKPLPVSSPYALPGAAEANTHRPHEG